MPDRKFVKGFHGFLDSPAEALIPGFLFYTCNVESPTKPGHNFYRRESILFTDLKSLFRLFMETSRP